MKRSIEGAAGRFWEGRPWAPEHHGVWRGKLGATRGLEAADRGLRTRPGHSASAFSSLPERVTRYYA